MRRRSRVQLTSAVLLLLVGSLTLLASSQSTREGFKGFWGARFRGERHRNVPRPRLPRPSTQALERLHHWNSIAIDASGLDHTPLTEGEDRVFGEQLGPGRASRAIAIVHLAIYEAVNAIAGNHESFAGVNRAPRYASIDAAIAQAAHDTLVEMFPSQVEAMNGHMQAEMRVMPRLGLQQGLQIGRRAAKAVMAIAADDGAAHAEPRIGIEFITSTEPGKWRQDPISKVPVALGANWGKVKPFVLESGAQFRVPPPPALDSPEYAAAFNEAKRLGGDGQVTRTRRRPGQTAAGIYWAYDGTPSLCAPPRLYNQIVMNIADQMGTDVVELSRLLALANVAMSDAGIAIWESKYYYEFWRPITGIREADPETGPSQLGDGNDATVGDPNFSPLGAPASNLQGPNFTPPFPTYPSGHAGFGGALFEILRRFYGTDDIRFTFVSEEYNGETAGQPGPGSPAAAAQLQITLDKPRKRTARAGSISAFTGRSTRPQASSRDVRWPPTYSSTRFADYQGARLILRTRGFRPSGGRKANRLLRSLTHGDSMTGHGERGGARRTGVGGHVERQNAGADNRRLLNGNPRHLARCPPSTRTVGRDQDCPFARRAADGVGDRRGGVATAIGLCHRQAPAGNRHRPLTRRTRVCAHDQLHLAVAAARSPTGDGNPRRAAGGGP